MPAVSKAQQRAAGADVGRCKIGEKPRTFGSCRVAEEFARGPGRTVKGLPERSALDRSTKGSPPLTDAEIAQGYRKIGGGKA